MLTPQHYAVLFKNAQINLPMGVLYIYWSHFICCGCSILQYIINLLKLKNDCKMSWQKENIKPPITPPSQKTLLYKCKTWTFLHPDQKDFYLFECKSPVCFEWVLEQYRNQGHRKGSKSEWANELVPDEIVLNSSPVRSSRGGLTISSKGWDGTHSMVNSP